MSTSCSHSENMLVLFLLVNIDRVTMVTDFGEFNKKTCYTKAFIQNISKIVARIGKFSRSDN